MSQSTPGTTAAVQKVLAGISDPELESRYPNGAHSIGADHPRHGDMVTRALFAGEPVVLVYPDGREMLLTPERAAGAAAVMVAILGIASLLGRIRRKRDRAGFQMPPRTRIEARDSAGLSTVA